MFHQKLNLYGFFSLTFLVTEISIEDNLLWCTEVPFPKGSV